MWTALFLTGLVGVCGCKVHMMKKGTLRLHLPGCSSLFILFSQPFPVTLSFLWSVLPNVHIPPAVQRGSWRVPDRVRCPQRRERALGELLAWRHTGREGGCCRKCWVPCLCWLFMPSFPGAAGAGWIPCYCFNGVVLLGSDGWGSGPKPWLGITQPFPLPSQGNFGNFLGAFWIKGGRDTAISPSKIVTSVDVTENNDMCLREKLYDS